MRFNKSILSKALVAFGIASFILSLGSEAIALERKLAGISLGSQVTTVLKKYGNPTRVSIGADSGMSGIAGLSGGMSAPAAVTLSPMDQLRARQLRPGGVAPAPPPPTDVSPFAGLGAGLGPGALPGLSSVGGMPGASPSGIPGSGEQPANGDEVRWIYEMPGKNKMPGPTLEFIVSEGIVSQITVSGGSAWTGAKTAKGVGLCNNYKTVLLNYGYPDKHEYVGNYLRVGYLQRSNIMFTLRDSSTVVGITIGLKQD